MSRTLTIENDTHWKSSDILRIVRAARDAAEFDPTLPIRVAARWSNNSHIAYGVATPWPGSVVVKIYLPKRGPKTLHPNALVALGAAGIDSKTPILAVSDSFFLANALAWEFSCRRVEDADAGLKLSRRSINPPGWGGNLIITKYADPAKDAAYVTLVAKKEKVIVAAQKRIDKWTLERDRAVGNLKRAQKALKTEQKALVDAKKRRGL